jgi:peptidoglycan/LPS O-acetylase OafA/YrhL
MGLRATVLPSAILTAPMASTGALRDRPAPATAEHFRVLDSLRGLCAIIVVLYHFPVKSHLASLGFVRGGYMFVDFFFVLSGFVIAYSYAHRITDRDSLMSFMTRRFFRLWPLHLFIISLYLFVEMLNKPIGAELGAISGRTLPDLWRSVTLTSSFGMDHHSAWNVPSWSISAEWWTYLLFGLLVLTLQRTLWSGLVALVVVSLGILVATHDAINITFDLGLVRCLVGFGLGALLALRWSSVKARLQAVGEHRVALLEIALVLVIIGFVSTARLTPWSFLAPFLFTVAVAVFALEAGPVSQLMRQRLFIQAGLLSYSIYMMHQLVMGRMRNAADLGESLGLRLDATNAWQMDALTLAMLVLVWLAAAFTYRFIEVPGQAIGAGVVARMRRAQTA